MTPLADNVRPRAFLFLSESQAVDKTSQCHKKGRNHEKRTGKEL